MGKEHFIKDVRRPALHRQRRLLGRLVRQRAAGRRVARSLRRRPDRLHLPRPAGDRHRPARTPTCWRTTSPSPRPAAFTDAQQVAVTGYKGVQGLPRRGQPGRAHRSGPRPRRRRRATSRRSGTTSCRSALRYDPKTNPKGARPTVYDDARNIYGVDPATGFALRPFDNVGVQYGLAALSAGTITRRSSSTSTRRSAASTRTPTTCRRAPSATPARSSAPIRAACSSAAAAASPRSRCSTSPASTTTTAAITTSGSTSRCASGWRRRTATPTTTSCGAGNPVPADTAWTTVRRLGGGVEGRRGGPARRARRPSATSRRTRSTAAGPSPTDFIAEPQTFSRQPRTRCNALFPSFGFPRLVAGGPIAANVLKCQLKPVDPATTRRASRPRSWHGLRRIFPTGVCDWSRPGVNQTAGRPMGLVRAGAGEPGVRRCEAALTLRPSARRPNL